MPLEEVTTYYLEMTDPAQLRPARPPKQTLEIRQAELPLPELNRFFYAAVGPQYHWLDRRGWGYDRWAAYAERPEIETWIGYVQGTPIGYFELERQPEANTEIVYFGLLARFVGQGLGGPFLAAAIERGWLKGTRRVWVHTCTLDHPRALGNYQARGFRLYHQEVKLKEILPLPEVPW
jgi:GNAT superfamily N-acetyltransferase